MEAFDPSDNRIAQWVRLETLKDAVPLLLPVSSAFGWGLINSIPILKSLVTHVAGLLPQQLLRFWMIAIMPGWILLTLACSAWTAFRYARAISESPVKGTIAGFCLTPAVCLLHCFVIGIGATIIEQLSGGRIVFL